MFCNQCGKEIEDTAKFCPHCGKEMSTPATNGQAQNYVDKAKEESQSFSDDVKQVDKDKGTSNFFKKNKYRNVKIIAILFVVVILITGLFSGGDSNFSENYAKEIAENEVLESLNNPNTAKISNVKIYDSVEGTSQDLYVVTLTTKAENSQGVTEKANCVLFIMLSKNVTKSNYEKNNITSNDVNIYGKFYYTDDEETEAVEKLESILSEIKSFMN